MPMTDYPIKALKALRTGVGAVGSDVLEGVNKLAPNTSKLVRDGVDNIKVKPESETYKMLQKLPADAPELAAGAAALGLGGYLGYKALSDKRASEEDAAIEIIATDILSCETSSQALSKLAFYMEVAREDIMDKAASIVTEELAKVAYTVTDEDYNAAGYDSDDTVDRKLNPLKWGGAAAGLIGGAYLGHKAGTKWVQPFADELAHEATVFSHDEPLVGGMSGEQAAKLIRGGAGILAAGAGAAAGGAVGGYAGQTIGAAGYNADRVMNDEPVDPYAATVTVGNLGVPLGALVAAKGKGATRIAGAAGGLMAPPLARSLGSALKDRAVEDEIE